MEKGTKGIAAGIGTGSVIASIPALTGVVINTLSKPKDMDDMLKAENGEIINCSGEKVLLKGVNLCEVPFTCLKNEEAFEGSADEIFDALKERFGHYGAREVFNTCFAGAYTPDDIKALAKMGINCVNIPMRSVLLAEAFKSKKNQIHFAKMDALIKACKKAGVYVILSLEEKPEKDKEIVKLWEKIAKHYAKETAIAGYNLIASPDGDLSSLCKTYSAVIKALRKLQDNHIIILSAKDIADADKIMKADDSNIAFGFSLKTATITDNNQKLEAVKAVKNKGCAVIGTNLYPAGYEETATALTNEGIGWCMGGL
ncbi:MAG: glycoside hydrolase family 5 protein, partial [Clostridia bacterium]|nr:glycoside hydrolase family 5 protein [Clostridia bacterium]